MAPLDGKGIPEAGAGNGIGRAHAAASRAVAEIDVLALATNDRSVVCYGPDAVAPQMLQAPLQRDAMFAITDDRELGLDFLHPMRAEHVGPMSVSRGASIGSNRWQGRERVRLSVRDAARPA